MADMSKDEALLRMRAFLQAHFALNSFPGVTEALATLEAHLAAPAAPTPVEVDSGLERFMNAPGPQTAHVNKQLLRQLVEVDRAAIATAAKLEGERIGYERALSELDASFMRYNMLSQAAACEEIAELRSKLTAEGGE